MLIAFLAFAFLTNVWVAMVASLQTSCVGGCCVEGCLKELGSPLDIRSAGSVGVDVDA